MTARIPASQHRRLRADARERASGNLPAPSGSRFVHASRGFSSPGITPGNVRIFVDAVQVTNRCIGASEADGFADCWKPDGSGRPFVAPGTDVIATERLTGTVEIRVV